MVSQQQLVGSDTKRRLQEIDKIIEDKIMWLKSSRKRKTTKDTKYTKRQDWIG